MRLSKSRLPKVWPSHIEKGYGYRELDDKYHALPKCPLMVTGRMLTGFIAESLHLDAILGAAVMAAHPCPADYKMGDAVIPLPLELLWLSPDDLPLWAASDFEVLDSCESREYWHKRYPVHRAHIGAKANAKTTAGRWREYRVPVTANSCRTVKAVCVGSQAEVERLLSHVSHVGKKGAAGYGRVEWRVEQVNMDALAAIHENKALPIEYAAQVEKIGKIMPSCGWTPPYWYAPHWRDCVVSA